MFEKATREKLRFNFKGNISTEDLWDLSLKELDEIYKNLMSVKKATSDEDSLLVTKNTENTINDIRIDIVKHIFSVKTAEKDKKEERAARTAKKRQLQAILANKQSEELQGKSVEELSRLINELEE